LNSSSRFPHGGMMLLEQFRPAGVARFRRPFRGLDDVAEEHGDDPPDGRCTAIGPLTARAEQ
jgi:hypothetical protein